MARLPLRGLDETAVTAMVAAIGGGSAASATIVRAVAERTQGNPFFVQKLVRHRADHEPASGLPYTGVPYTGVPERVRILVLASEPLDP